MQIHDSAFFKPEEPYEEESSREPFFPVFAHALSNSFALAIFLPVAHHAAGEHSDAVEGENLFTRFLSCDRLPDGSRSNVSSCCQS